MRSAQSDSLADFILQRTQRSVDRTILTRGSDRWTNGEFLTTCRRLASRLRDEASDVSAIAVSAESSAWLPFLVWATVIAEIDLWLLPALPAGATLLEHTRSLPTRVIYSDAPGLVPDDRQRPLNALFAELPVDPGSGSGSGSGRRAAFVFQTSGTEGAPKSVRCEHWQFAKVLSAMLDCGALNHAIDTQVYLSQPLQHSYGLCSFLEYCAAGGSVVLPPERSPLGPAGDLMQVGSGVQAIEGVPYFWSQFAKLQKRLDLPDLRHLGLGGGRVDPAVMEKVLARFPQATVSVRYGLTETPSVATHKVYVPPHGADWSSSGRVVPAYRVEVQDPSGQVVLDGTEGEIHVMGDCVAAPLGDLRTGDLGYFDSRGELVVTGRRSAFIKRRGFRLSPETIESAATGCDGVIDCRALGVDDRLILEVVSDVELSVPKLFDQLRARLPASMVPDHVRRVVTIARTYSGKIKRS